MSLKGPIKRGEIFGDMLDCVKNGNCTPLLLVYTTNYQGGAVLGVSARVFTAAALDNILECVRLYVQEEKREQGGNNNGSEKNPS